MTALPEPIYSRRTAFTLLEVMLATALLSLLVVGVFGIINAGLVATTELTAQQRRDQEFQGLYQLLSRTLRELPASASLEARPGESDTGAAGQLVFRDAAGLFNWGSHSTLNTEVVLTTRKQPGGLRTLVLYHVKPGTGVSGIQDASRQLDLIEDLRVITFRFYHAASARWFPDWKSNGPHPSLVEMTLAPADEPNERRFVFYLPPLVGHHSLMDEDYREDEGGDDDDGDDD